MGYNSLEWSKRLQAAGLEQNIADEQAMMMTDFAEEHAVSKADLQAMKIELEGRIDAAEARMTMRIGAMIGIAATVIVALIKLV